MNNRYNKEYQEYYVYALEQFLINTYEYSEYDARCKVMQDFDETLQHTAQDCLDETPNFLLKIQ